MSSNHHAMKTRRASKWSELTERGGTEREREVECAKVNVELVSRGEILDDAYRSNGEIGGGSMEEEVAKVVETGALLGLKFVGNEEILHNEIASREMEDRERFREL